MYWCGDSSLKQAALFGLEWSNLPRLFVGLLRKRVLLLFLLSQLYIYFTDNTNTLVEKEKVIRSFIKLFIAFVCAWFLWNCRSVEEKRRNRKYQKPESLFVWIQLFCWVYLIQNNNTSSVEVFIKKEIRLREFFVKIALWLIHRNKNNQGKVYICIFVNIRFEQIFESSLLFWLIWFDIFSPQRASNNYRK